MKPDVNDLKRIEEGMQAFGIALVEISSTEWAIKLQLADRAPVRAPEANVQPTSGEIVEAGQPGVFSLNHPMRSSVAVAAGDLVSEHQVLGYLKAGDVLFAVRSPRAARVSAVLAEDGALVGYGTPLFRIA